MKTTICTAASAAAFILSGSIVHAGVLIPVPDVPGSPLTVVQAINDQNIIVGQYDTGDFHTYGFIGTLDGNYTTFNYADGFDTLPRGLSNDGTVVGWVSTRQEGFFPFVRSPDGQVRLVTKHGAAFSGEAYGISGSRFVGHDASGDKGHAFIGKTGGYPHFARRYHLALKPVFSLYPRAINSAGDIAGWYSKSFEDSPHSFFDRSGAVSDVEYHGASGTAIGGLNDNGIISGYTVDSEEGLPNGAFLFDTNTWKFRRIKSASWAWGINNAGLVAVSGLGGNPYIYCPRTKAECPHTAHALEINGE